MTTFSPVSGPIVPADPQALSMRGALTDAESQQVLQFFAGPSPGTVDMAISTVKALQGEPR
jgi:hypothetical protein